MKNWSYIFVFLFYFEYCYAASNYTVTPQIAAQCMEYINRDGYKYKRFFSVENLKNPGSEPDVTFEMHFAILASSNGHVLLSTVPEPGPDDPVYEFVIGGGGNKFCELRKNQRRNPKSTEITPDILSAIDYKAFYIKVDSDGTVELGEEGSPNPIIAYLDLDPIKVKYVSFTSWRGVDAKFLFDCPVVKNGTEVKDENTWTQEDLTKYWPVSMKLRFQLAQSTRSKTPPSPETVVQIGYFMTAVDFNDYEDELTLNLFVLMAWQDDDFTWNPNKYNGTKKLNFYPWQIWKPTLVESSIMDGDSLDANSKGSSLISVDYTGAATYHFTTKIKKLCPPLSQSVTRWPHETHSCVLLLEPWHPHENLKLRIMSVDDDKLKKFASTAVDVVQNNWEVIAKHVVIDNETWSSFMTGEDDDGEEVPTFVADRIMLAVDLRRSSTTYDVVFYVPLLVLMVFMLLSFWMPQDSARLALYSGLTFFITTGLCYVDYLIPCHHVPGILVQYSVVCLSSVLALTLQAALPLIIQKIDGDIVIRNNFLRMIFCLPPLNASEHYESFNAGYESECSTTTLAAEEDTQIEAPPPIGGAAELVKVINNAMFAIYFVVFIVMLVYHY